MERRDRARPAGLTQPSEPESIARGTRPGTKSARRLFGRSGAAVVLVLLALVAGGCATPVGVERADAQSVHRELTGNVLSTGELSDFTQNVLRIGGVVEVAEDDPAAALATIHDAVVTGFAGPNAMFAYAELAFKHASKRGGRPYYLASAVYAFAYLVPDSEDLPRRCSHLLIRSSTPPFPTRGRWTFQAAREMLVDPDQFVGVLLIFFSLTSCRLRAFRSQALGLP